MTKFAVAILLALTMPARAQDMNSANFFLPGCKGFPEREKNAPNQIEAIREGLCTGFVVGLWHGTEDFCPPERVTRNQSLAVIVKYIEARPERMHEPFGDLALEALTAAWPCKR